MFSFAVSLCSCAVHSGLTFNTNNSTTNVVLQSNNYRIIQKVKGSASGVWFLYFGGGFKPLVENARNQMIKSAPLVGSSRAIINETVEINNKFFIIAGMKTVTVSAFVIEFIDTNGMWPQSVQQRNNQQQASESQPQANYSASNPQSQDQLRSSPSLTNNDSRPSIQISSWYNSRSSDGTQSRTPVMLTAQKRETGQAYPQYLIISIDGINLNQPIVASYDDRYNSYVFYVDNVPYQFTVANEK